MRVRSVLAAVGVALAVVAGVVAVPSPAAEAVQVAQDRVVSADPVDWTPHVLDGKVKSVAQVGNTMVLGGSFTQVRSAKDPTVIARQNLVAFDAATGAISSTFVPALDGQVETVAAAPDGRSVFVGGAFRTVNGAASKGLAKLDVGTGQAVAGFSAPVDGRVADLDVRGDKLYVGGGFSYIRGMRRGALARVDVNSGAVNRGLDLPFTGVHNGGTTRLVKQDISPDGSRLVAIGNFTAVGGQARRQIALLDLTTSPARVAAWSTNRYDPVCLPGWASRGFDTELRDVDIAPDGSYFVAVTTGGGGGPSRMCDTTARWELTRTAGAGQQPTWVDFTGGDTLLSVAVTGTAVYVGGHQQYHNSYNGNVPPNGSTTVPPGAVPRSGIAALDPVNGLPLSWNPGRTRGQGVYDLLATPQGLWVTSDTDRIGNWEYHGRVALMPLTGGTRIPAVVPATLPGELYAAGLTNNTITRRSFDGTALGPASVVSTTSWSHARGMFMINDKLYHGWSDGNLYVRSFDGVTVGPSTVVNIYGLNASVPIASVTSMFYDNGRLYYTVWGQPGLYYRHFTPESGVLGAQVFTVSGNGDGFDWRTTVGATVASGRMYFALSDGNLYSVPFVNGRPEYRDGKVISGPAKGDGQDWKSRGLFVLNATAGRR